MGGNPSPQISTPTPPPAPQSYASQVQDYVSSYPKLFNLEQTYTPQEANLYYGLYNQYAPQLAQEQYNIQNQLYPQTTALQENLASTAAQGMNTNLPDWAKQQYLSDFNAGIGQNANAPIGITDRSTGLLNLGEQWKRYYQNLGLSATGRQPLTAPASSINTGTNPQANLSNATNYGASTYGSYANAFANQNTVTQPRLSGYQQFMTGLGQAGSAFNSFAMPFAMGGV